MQKITLLLLICLPLFTFGQDEDAIYTVIFESNWSQEAHPHSSGNLPADAHWSRFVGVTHNADIQFVSMGTLASPGIEAVAESGNNTQFFNEVAAAVSAGDAFEPLSGSILDSPLGTMEIADFGVKAEFPLLTVVSMIAPSPDWMIAIDGISLIDSGGDWIVEQTIDLYAYDAGTDSGPDYSSPNMDTDPQQPISSLQNVTPFSSQKIGTLKIMLNELLSVDESQLNSFSLSPNPANNEITLTSPASNIGQVEIYSAIGQRVIAKTYNAAGQVRLDISDLSTGVYLVRLQTTDGKSIAKKLVKQ